MPTIIAICPYCRAGGVRAQDTALGSLAACPKCRSNFTILPEDKLPDWAAKAKPDATSFKSSSPLEETRATAAMPDRTEPSPVLPAEGKKAKKRSKPKEKPESARTPIPAPEPAPRPVPVLAAAPKLPVAEPEDEAPHTRADTATVFALVALILVGPTVLASQLPYGRFIAIPLALAGMIGGLLCLGAEGKARLAAAAAAFLHLLTLAVVLFLPSWLNLDPWSGSPAAREEERKQLPAVYEHATGIATPANPNDWLDATTHSWQRGDVRVSLRPSVGPVELTGPKGAKVMTKERYLHLVLQVRHIGFEQELPLSGWAAGQGADGVRVADAAGKVLAPATFQSGWGYEGGKPVDRVRPGFRSEVVLLFAAPAAKSEFVQVQLPGFAAGVQDEIRFRAATAGPFGRPVP